MMRGGCSKMNNTHTSKLPVWIGWDPREIMAGVVAERSMRVHTTIALDVRRLALLQLRHKSLYTRPTETRNGHLWDVISTAPMSTEHAIMRFFVPYLQEYRGWALFVDGDVLVRGDLGALFALADPRYAIQVVQHAPEAQGSLLKKDGAIQTQYARKNWSSVMLFNCGHPANRALDLATLNSRPGRDLHRFCWLRDDQIGALPADWNYLVHVSPPLANPAIVHYTLGAPNLSDHHHDPFADEWWEIARRAGYEVPEAAILPQSTEALG